MGLDEFLDSIANELTKQRISKSELAKRSNISKSYIYKMFSRESLNISPGYIRKIARALGISYSELHNRLYGNMIRLKRETQKKEKITLVNDDDSAFVADITVADNTQLSVNQNFTKIWEIRNTGNVIWENRFLKREDIESGDGALISENNLIPIPETKPNETVQIKINFKAPRYPCTTISYWKMVDKQGIPFFPQKKGLWCRVIIID